MIHNSNAERRAFFRISAGADFVDPVLPCTHVLANPGRYPSRLAANPHFAGAARPWNRHVLPGVAFWFETPNRV